MIYTFGNLIVDFLLYIDQFPVQAQDLQGVSHVAIGPGGAGNVAIMAARFGLPVGCLGEIGPDYFGQIVINGLEKEGIETNLIRVNQQGATPVAGVLVDPQSEPAYLGYPGEQRLSELPEDWCQALQDAQALFVDGWIETQSMPALILAALTRAQEAGAKTFFDPGPGNPRLSNDWHKEAAALAHVVLATESEIIKLTAMNTPHKGAAKLLQEGSQLVVIKRGENGVILQTADSSLALPGLPVAAVDATGAGDSMAAAVIYGCLNQLPLPDLATLANATGAAKVLKIGTGHQVPTTAEIAAILNQFNLQVNNWPNYRAQTNAD